MDAATELGRNPVSKHQIQPEYGDEQADAGRDCRNRLARPNSQARTRTDHEQDLQPYPVDPYSCYKLGTDPMAYGGFINGRHRGTREESRKHQIQPEYGDEQADAGRDGWTRLARPNSQARTGKGEYSFSLFS